MDLRITGKFIQECRKAKNLTQAQLSQNLNVSEKTISKWECGNGFPDTTLILPLCKELNITANELLSGKKIANDTEYKDQAEINLINLKQSQEKNVKFLLNLEWVLGIFSIILLMTFIIVASIFEMPNYVRIILCISGAILSMIGFHFCLIIEKDAGFYECSHCHHKYIPTYKQVTFAMHIGRTRYFQCPKCHKHSWHKKKTTKD